MSKSPEQQLYDEIFRESLALGYETYQFNPPKDSSYPYVVISSTQLLPMATKSYLIGRVVAVIDIWGDESSRMEISNMANDLTNRISKIKQIKDGHRWSMDHNATSIEMLLDTTTPDNLWRARIEVQLKFE